MPALRHRVPGHTVPAAPDADLDRCYLGVHPDRQTLLVSPRLRADWGNGEEFYERAAPGEPIRVPDRRADRPNHDFLAWHADTMFLVLIHSTGPPPRLLTFC